MSKKVMVFVGTSKGGFIFSSNEKRKKWQTDDIQFKSWNVMHMQLDPRDQCLHAATSHLVYGPTTHYSDDLGKTWTQAKQVPLLTRSSRSGRPVEADEGQIVQVINNLVINADQAMPEGGIINIKCENISVHNNDVLPVKEGKYVKISIEDHGIGIAEDHLQKIFDPYFTTKQKGSGLGLATSYSIIKKHGGYITVESRQGSGTTFRIYFPACEGKTSAETTEDETFLPGEGNVLVMDDEDAVRDVAMEMLSLIGYEVEAARDGNEAITFYQEAKQLGRPFDLVILDLTVPGGMGGSEAIRRLLEIDPDVKAVVSSGYSNDPIMANYQDHGFLGVITKPYEIKELNEIVYKVMNLQSFSPSRLSLSFDSYFRRSVEL